MNIRSFIPVKKQTMRGKRTVLIFVVVFWISGCFIPKTEQVILDRAHAHNDYEHERPLLDALEHGFGSVEADVHLIGGKLLVAHDKEDADPEKTLQALYLEPLRQRVRQNGGNVYQGSSVFTLVIDVKTEAEPTYAALSEILPGYKEILTGVEAGKLRRGAVQVIISGNRARESMAQERIRYAAYDGRLEDLESDEPTHFIPWISFSAEDVTEWDGQGAMPDAVREKLLWIVETAHRKGRKVRIWGIPDQEKIWQELWAAKVDVLNADDLAGLRRFLLKKQGADQSR